MFGEINKYLALKADFNCKLMFCKINFTLPNIYFTNLYSTYNSEVGTAWNAQKPGLGPGKWPITRKQNFFWGGPNGKVVDMGVLEPHWSMFSTRKRGVSLIPWYEVVPTILLPPPNELIWAQKWSNLALNWHFELYIDIFDPLGHMADRKTMRIRCLSVFPLCWYQNFYLLPKKLGFFAQKRPNLALNWHFWPVWS